MKSPIKRHVLIHEQSMPQMYALASKLLNSQSEDVRRRLQSEIQVRLEKSFAYEDMIARLQNQNDRLIAIIEKMVAGGVLLSTPDTREVEAVKEERNVPTGSRHLSKILERTTESRKVDLVDLDEVDKFL